MRSSELVPGIPQKRDGAEIQTDLLSLCMGHVRTQMAEHYIAEAKGNME
jgi:hypothetical protein